MIQTRVLRGESLFEDWSGPWKHLVASASNATPFQTFEWQKAWYDTFGKSKEPFAIATFEGRDLVGWFPLIRSFGTWTAVRAMGTGASDYLHPLICKGATVEVAEATLDMLRSEARGCLLDLHGLREDFSPLLYSTLDGSMVRQSTCLVLDLESSFKQYVQSLSKSLRYDVRRLDKQPFKSGEARIDQASPASVSVDLEILFELHAKRWHKRWQPGAFSSKHKAFHRLWTAAAVKQGWLRLSILRKDDRPIGALYAMAINESTYYYQAGMDPDYNSFSPGSLLVADAIRVSIESGDGKFDFLRGDEPYKRRWQPTSEWASSRLLISEEGLANKAGLIFNLAASKLEAKVRNRLEGKSLVKTPVPKLPVSK